jgi:signal transduction histidine kinase
MSWIAARKAKRNLRTAQVEFTNSAGLSSGQIPESVIDLLKLFDAENIVIGNGEIVISHSEGISTFNLIRDQHLNSESLLRLVRAARRSGQTQEVTMELPRGPIGAGTHDLLVRVSLLGEDGFVVILIFDDSEMRRLDSIRRDFVANISHELKTPIGALSILSEAVLGASNDPEAVTRFATRMQAEATRLTDLVQEIIKDKTRLMHQFAAVNKDNICIKMDTRIYEEIIELLLKLLLLQEPPEHYKLQVGIIRDMIKNSNNIL